MRTSPSPVTALLNQSVRSAASRRRRSGAGKTTALSPIGIGLGSSAIITLQGSESLLRRGPRDSAVAGAGFPRTTIPAPPNASPAPLQQRQGFSENTLF